MRNVILIGMAASGKSTIGKELARRLGWAFVDTDALIEAWWGAPLQAIVDHLGQEAFVRAEADQIMRLFVERCVIATGGSVVYSDAAMEHLADLGHIVHLRTSFNSIAKRLRNPLSRGLAIGPGQSIEELYAERSPLYARFAQLTVDTDTLTPEATCASIERALSALSEEST